MFLYLPEHLINFIIWMILLHLESKVIFCFQFLGYWTSIYIINILGTKFDDLGYT